jgi:hypothetical protein
MNRVDQINHRGKKANKLLDVYSRDGKGGWKYRLYTFIFRKDICAYALRNQKIESKARYDRLHSNYKTLLQDLCQEVGVMKLPIDNRMEREGCTDIEFELGEPITNEEHEHMNNANWTVK